MLKKKNKFFFILAFLMGLIIVLSNYLVQFPFNYMGLQDLLTYGAFSYPVAFLITDLSNRKYGKKIAKKIVYFGFILGVILTFYFSTKSSILSFPLQTQSEIKGLIFDETNSFNFFIGDGSFFS